MPLDLVAQGQRSPVRAVTPYLEVETRSLERTIMQTPMRGHASKSKKRSNGDQVVDASHITSSTRRHLMARITVTTDPTTRHASPILLDESVYSIDLSDDHAAAQLIERLGWAIADAENAQRAEVVVP